MQEHATASGTYNDYTDGIRVGVYCAELPESCNIFLAKVLAIRKAAEIADNTKNGVKNINMDIVFR